MGFGGGFEGAGGAQTPSAHATSHLSGGTDPITTPPSHGSTHVNDDAIPEATALDPGLMSASFFSKLNTLQDVNAAVTAAGSDQAGATALTKHINYVTAGNQSTPNGVRLPTPSYTGEVFFVFNAISAPSASLVGIAVYPPMPNHTILPNAVNIRDFLLPHMCGVYVYLGSSTWRAFNLPMKTDHISLANSESQYFYQLATFVSGLSCTAGTGTFASGLNVSQGQFWHTVPATNTTAGTTMTVNWASGNRQVIDLQGATGTVTLTLSNPIAAGAHYMLKVIQGSVARNITWPSTVKWPGGTPPTISVANDAMDLIELLWDGTNYLASFRQAYA